MKSSKNPSAVESSRSETKNLVVKFYDNFRSQDKFACVVWISGKMSSPEEIKFKIHTQTVDCWCYLRKYLTFMFSYSHTQCFYTATLWDFTPQKLRKRKQNKMCFGVKFRRMLLVVCRKGKNEATSDVSFREPHKFPRLWWRRRRRRRKY